MDWDYVQIQIQDQFIQAAKENDIATAKKFDENNNTIIGCVKEVDALLEGFHPGGKEIANNLRRIADKVEEAQTGTSMAKITGSAVGIAGGIAGVVGGGLLIFATGGSAAPIVAGVGVTAAIFGSATGISAEVANSIVKSEAYKQVEREVNEGVKIYEDVAWKLEKIKELLNENDRLLLLMTGMARQVATAVWDTVKRIAEKLEERLEGMVEDAVLEEVVKILAGLGVGGSVSGAAIRSSGRAAGRLLGGAAIAISALGIALDIYTMTRGVLDLNKKQDVMMIRELATIMDKFNEAHRKDGIT